MQVVSARCLIGLSDHLLRLVEIGPPCFSFIHLQYWALCDDVGDFKLSAGVRYLSFSIDTAPECISWLILGIIKSSCLKPPCLER